MNEVLFKELCSNDLSNLNKVISKGNFESEEFNKAVLNLSNTLAMLYQAMAIQRGKYDCQMEKKDLFQSYSEMV